MTKITVLISHESFLANYGLPPGPINLKMILVISYESACSSSSGSSVGRHPVGGG